ncbi:hypothetical protein CHH57_19995 [Niallia circulans]|uniref:Uncharacterized protein n=1 Tax=Niallia circulans TaxID=1397 RepID=A0AA91YZH2_NIACI|nr:hypothetical protein CHH57_19995 [Niallia circulans]
MQVKAIFSFTVLLNAILLKIYPFSIYTTLLYILKEISAIRGFYPFYQKKLILSISIFLAESNIKKWLEQRCPTKNKAKQIRMIVWPFIRLSKINRSRFNLNR